ncbi:MAG: PAS domain S-box protein [Pseudomonadota bacterium]
MLDRNGAAVATFAVYYTEPRRPSPEQLDIIGRVARIVGIAIARQRHDEALRDSEARFRQIAENIRDVFWIADGATGRAFYVSPAYESIWGRTAEALYASDAEWISSVHPDDRERMRHAAQRLPTGGFDETYRIVRPDGEVRWIHDRGYPVRNERGQVYRVVGVATDITARRQVEAQLHRLSQAIEQSSESIIITDTKGRIEYVNEAFARNSGYSREELLGRNPRLLQSGKTPRETYASLWATLRRGDVWRGEFVNRRKDGSEYIEAAIISPIRAPDGTVVNFLGTKEDVTARRAAERELERYREHLEELVAERTRELQAARAQAEAANRAKSAFLASMSHEIRTPMNGVLGMLDVLESGRLTEQQREMVRTARDSGRTLLAIIDDILDFSKIEAGQMHVERTPLAVAEVVESLAESLVPLALRKDVDLSVYVDPWLPRQVTGDALRLRQILFNLAGNAIKFSGGRAERRGRVALRVTVAQRAPFALSIAVIDNGIGMSEETLARLFTPFTQAEASTTRRYGGTGLGLTICKRLADLLGGRIDVASRLGEGSTFTLTLPCEVLDAAPAPAPFDLAGVHCLLLQAPEMDTDALAAYLQHAGAQVRIAPCAEQAAAMAADLPPPAVAVRHAGAAQPGHEPALQGAPQVRHVVLTRGRRRRARVGADGVVTVDSAALRRAALLRAVAVAAGRASPEAPAEGTPQALPAPAASGSLGEARILVAEDDEVNRLVIRHQLEVLGHAAEFAVDGAEALRRWQHGRYALLLTDVHMPGMDGYELTRAIREQEARRGGPRLPIVALTANAMRGEAERAQAAGMDDYLTKPLRIEVLRAALQRWLAPVPTESAPAAAMREPTFDASALTRVIGDDAAAARDLLAQWRAAATGQLAELDDAAAHDDRARIATLAHRMKSSARAVGAAALGALCERLEGAAQTADGATIRALLAGMRQEYAAVEAAIAESENRTAAATGAD